MSTLNINKNQHFQLPPKWTTFIQEEIYHKNAQNGHVLSSTMLKEFRKCPAQYNEIVTGKARRTDKSVFRIGRAVHKLLLEGEDAYNKTFFVGGPVNKTTGRSFGVGSKAFGDWLSETGLQAGRVITGSEAIDIARMCSAVRQHAEAIELLKRGWPERCAEAECHGVACQARFDWLTPEGTIVDIKTTFDITRFEDDAKRYDYLNQFAFYREVATAAGATIPAMAAVVIEKRQPFRVGVWHFPPSVLEPYVMQNRTSLKQLLKCRKTNRWPTGYETARKFPPAGMPRVWYN